jgi:hypothetical protein
LYLSGLHLDPILINGVGGVMATAPTISEILKVQREWRLLARIDILDCSSYVAGGEAIEAFWRVLVSDYHWDMSGIQRRCTRRDYKAYRNWKRDLEPLAKFGQAILPPCTMLAFGVHVLAVDFSSPRRATFEWVQPSFQKEIKSTSLREEKFLWF